MFDFILFIYLFIYLLLYSYFIYLFIYLLLFLFLIKIFKAHHKLVDLGQADNVVVVKVQLLPQRVELGLVLDQGRDLALQLVEFGGANLSLVILGCALLLSLRVEGWM